MTFFSHSEKITLSSWTLQFLLPLVHSYLIHITYSVTLTLHGETSRIRVWQETGIASVPVASSLCRSVVFPPDVSPEETTDKLKHPRWVSRCWGLCPGCSWADWGKGSLSLWRSTDLEGLCKVVFSKCFIWELSDSLETLHKSSPWPCSDSTFHWDPSSLLSPGTKSLYLRQTDSRI